LKEAKEYLDKYLPPLSHSHPMGYQQHPHSNLDFHDFHEHAAARFRAEHMPQFDIGDFSIE
jgi:hypothetical protein